MIDSNQIKALYESERRQDLLDLLLEESQYTIPLRDYDGDETRLTLEEKELRGCAIDHLRFVISYGFVQSVVNDNGKIYAPRYQEFENWLKAGCPGLISLEVEAYLNDNSVNT
ncbi:hypothetical protein [Microbulbifer sp. PAAF003]|uniref:hypothetical protein n=1 Tax=unclassified Microbulbifer TaxID=2619833 RepID=UPI004039DB83